MVSPHLISPLSNKCLHLHQEGFRCQLLAAEPREAAAAAGVYPEEGSPQQEPSRALG